MNVTGQPLIWLRLEGLAVFAAGLVAYRWQGEPWTRFLILFMLPDISMAGYAAGPALGARLYNLAHNYVVPLFLAFWGVAVGRQDVLPYAIVWMAHIGFDRMLGFGLKYPSGFATTHLSRLPAARRFDASD